MPPRRQGNGIESFGEILQPSEAQEPILSTPVRGALLEWLTEIWAEDELRAVGVPPRRRALFDGAPGVGKTTLAHHLAGRLGLPMLAVLPDRIMTSYVSASAAAVGDLFDAVQNVGAPLVLFFDEFESLAQKRMHGGRNTVAEADHNHMVNTLLNRLDAYEGFAIAATNTGSAIDPAVWRRFEIHISLDLPGDFERQRILSRYLAPYGLPQRALGTLADAFETASPALMRQFAEGLKRQLVVGPKAGWEMNRRAVLSRLLATVHPHPDLGKPRLWSHGADDAAVRGLPWPLPMAADLEAETAPAAEDGATPADGGNVVSIAGPGAGGGTP